MSEFNDHFRKWLDECGESEPDPDRAFGDGWNRCKEEVLKILKENWTGLDMSPNSCDLYYIEKIEKL